MFSSLKINILIQVSYGEENEIFYNHVSINQQTILKPNLMKS